MAEAEDIKKTPETPVPNPEQPAAAKASEGGKKGAARKGKAPTTKPEGTPVTDAAILDPLAAEPVAKIVKAKGAKNILVGTAHVLATFNNTIVSITDPRGNVIAWSSAGKAGFKGSRKSTAYAAQMAAQDCGRQAMSHGMKEVEVLVSGPGLGRESAVRSLQAVGLEITCIRDVTPMPHNGCRPRKARRV